MTRRKRDEHHQVSRGRASSWWVFRRTFDKVHGDAFRELESNLRDCARMGEIAAELMLNAKVENDGLRFAVFHTAEMLIRLEKEYDARWNDERSQP
jgi:hypothetical protein